jgi:hypothetical protein
MMQERTKGRTQQQAAVKANLKSRKTVAKYEQVGQLPSQRKQGRSYRTRSNPFAEDWPQIEQMLERSPELEAKSLFGWLGEQQPGKYDQGQLRTFQRRVQEWRALHQPQVAVLEQVHVPGEVLQTDGTWLSELGVTINGQPFKHLLIHCVLPYSNWEWGAIAQSESLLALQRAVQSTLFKLGYVPRYHQTDHMSAATYQLPREPEGGWVYNPAYLALLDHFGLQPRTIPVGYPQANGDIEASNGGLKRSLEQHLLLRGQRDFASLADYEAFVGQVLTKRNQGRQQRLAEEMAVMTPLRASWLPPYQEVRVKVNRGSLIRVQSNLYSVPTHLIGQQVTVHIYEWHLAVYYRDIQVEHLARLVGNNKQQVQYRHLVDSLLRKPGGFRQYRYRDAFFPQVVFRQAWERLNQWHSPRQADLSYLRIVRLAAHTLECEVADILTQLLASDQRWDETDVEQRLQARPRLPLPSLTVPVINLAQYDRLLSGGEGPQPCRPAHVEPQEVLRECA